MCKKIHRGGNAEQYHADKKYKEAVAEAVEACAEDTKGQRDIRMMSTLSNLAQCYAHLGQIEKSFAIEQRVYRM